MPLATLEYPKVIRSKRCLVFSVVAHMTDPKRRANEGTLCSASTRLPIFEFINENARVLKENAGAVV